MNNDANIPGCPTCGGVATRIATLTAENASVKKTLAEWIARAERAEEKLRFQEPIVKAAVHLDTVAEEIGDYSFFIDAAEARPEVNAYWEAVNSVEDAITEWRDALARKELGGDHA